MVRVAHADKKTRNCLGHIALVQLGGGDHRWSRHHCDDRGQGVVRGRRGPVTAPWNSKPYRSRWSVTRGLKGSNDSFMVQAMARSRMIRK